jgi:hypothetical protein
MAIRLNQEAVVHVQNLIKGQQYESNSDWSEAQPSAEEENRFIYIAAPSSPPNSALVPKTTTRSKAPPTGCSRNSLAKTTSGSFGKGGNLRGDLPRSRNAK